VPESIGLKRLALESWVTVNSTKSTSDDDYVPDSGSIWKSFKDDVISLTRNENEDMSSSSSSKKPPVEKALKIRLYPP